MSEAKTYISVPTSIEAIQWTGENAQEIWNFVGLVPLNNGEQIDAFSYHEAPSQSQLWVEANQSWLPLEVGEWILKDSKGFYPCKNDIFQLKYSSPEAVLEKFRKDVLDERAKQVRAGRGGESDEKTGIGRLLRMGHEFAQDGDHVKSDAMLMAALNVIAFTVTRDPKARFVRI